MIYIFCLKGKNKISLITNVVFFNDKSSRCSYVKFEFCFAHLATAAEECDKQGPNVYSGRLKQLLLLKSIE